MSIPTAAAPTIEIRLTPQSPEPAQPRGPGRAPSTAANPIRVLLVDDKLIMREGVRALLDREPGLHVVALASSVSEAVALDVRPDVVIADAALPDARGNDVVIGLRHRYARAGIFVLIDRDQLRPDEIVGGAADARGGVSGYALKTATAEEFLSGLRAVAQGVQYVQPTLRSRPHAAPADPPPPVADQAADLPEASETPAASEALTGKEREVLELLVLGHTNAEIASLSKVSLRTVEARRARVLQKLGVRTRADLVRVARRLL